IFSQKISRLAPVKRSSRREEALIDFGFQISDFGFGVMSLLTSAATRFRESEHLQNSDVSWGHEPGCRLQSGTGFQPVSPEQARCLCHFLRFVESGSAAQGGRRNHGAT